MKKWNKKNIVIIGGGGHAKVIYSILKSNEYFEYLGYADNKDRGIIPNHLGSDDVILNNHTKYNNLVIGVSYVDSVSDKIRNRILDKYLNQTVFSFPVIKSNNSFVNEDVLLGEGTVIINGSVINTGSEIGKFCVVNTNASIDHDCKIGFNTQISPGAILLGNVNLGDNVFIGAGATVLDDIKVADNIVVGAGSIVTKNLNEPGIYYGSPAKLQKGY